MLNPSLACAWGQCSVGYIAIGALPTCNIKTIYCPVQSTTVSWPQARFDVRSDQPRNGFHRRSCGARRRCLRARGRRRRPRLCRHRGGSVLVLVLVLGRPCTRARSWRPSTRRLANLARIFDCSSQLHYRQHRPVSTAFVLAGWCQYGCLGTRLHRGVRRALQGSHRAGRFGARRLAAWGGQPARASGKTRGQRRGQ